MTRTLRVGVVGAGAIAQVAHLPVLAKLKGVEVAAVCDNDLPKAQALARRFAVRDAFDDIEDLLGYAKPDAVVICTPNHLHEVHVIAALTAGVQVLCERPLALSAAGVQKIMALRERANRVVMVGMNHRFRSDVQAVHGFLRGGELGQLRAARAGWYVFRPSRAGPDWRRRRAESGGGAMLDLGLPLLDLALWLGGNPEPRHVTSALSRSDTAVEESGGALVLCQGGFSIFVDVSWSHVGDSERFWLDFMGDKGSASIAPLRVFKEMHGTPMNVTPTGAAGRENAFSASYRSEWAYFFATVRGEVEPPDLGEQLVLQRLLAAIYRSGEEGRDVSL
ncbi:MAG: Gfo/Idh/MocA family oxidoreductase [Gemmatimonadetes bacterium]|nr:Gfo/Idh/MocA family oxidoreductase [Gemmatimonadota bacterium]